MSNHPIDIPPHEFFITAMELHDMLCPEARKIIARSKDSIHPEELLHIIGKYGTEGYELIEEIRRRCPCEPAPSGRSKSLTAKGKRLDPKSLKSLSDRYCTKD